ncbi:MarR family transcriptional regulator [Holzapfeliella sp. He02]|uniref:HTH-type transcriptional regulator SarZ n=1 Tax=Holzapfeliella saturejae TaxID=3082953 RepID=A0ABU8SG43_9LACO
MDNEIILGEQLCFSIYQADKFFKRFYSKALEPFNLTYAQYIVMLALYEHESMSVKELGENVGLDSGTLTPLLRRLEKLDWVKRRHSAEDERRLVLTPTDSAVEKRQELYDHLNFCLSKLDLTPEQYKTLRETMTQLGSKLSSISFEI